tara:strand:- start:987 stop:1259 length:273 start_codon:yes stop_codon:yes gene_type:complete
MQKVKVGAMPRFALVVRIFLLLSVWATPAVTLSLPDSRRRRLHRLLGVDRVLSGIGYDHNSAPGINETLCPSPHRRRPPPRLVQLKSPLD